MNKKTLKRILAIGPHPDDIEFGCGGTLLKLSSEYEIHLLILTKGQIGGDGRTDEQDVSGNLIGAKKIWWGDYNDTEVPYSRQVINFFENIFNEIDPDIIFSNYYRDTHQDHRAVANNLMSATRYMKNVLFYEVPTSIDFNPTVFVDVEGVWEKKKELLKAHQSQIHETRVKGLSILDSAESCAIFRGFQGRVKYAEGFVPVRLNLNWAGL